MVTPVDDLQALFNDDPLTFSVSRGGSPVDVTRVSAQHHVRVWTTPGTTPDRWNLFVLAKPTVPVWYRTDYVFDRRVLWWMWDDFPLRSVPVARLLRGGEEPMFDHVTRGTYLLQIGGPDS